ncbi:methyltransferase domain-containing protein [Ramlibacter sp. USB13]|uniref:Methyltransferase domain-containing protein n=1 Tax=Ramlibacter cellulosilyticus TaxID=2764187 RepID=A0A923MNI6_9BURK|nr:methyltransferase domain-containing protein [Ramlibacter cellulosilyticus]MBC5781953.1 methyltransferase domain-containing protein [Ramlibacter cellulosilyticus]
MSNKRVLNVGGNSKQIPLPPAYAGYEHLLLDIQPGDSVDIVCDARQLTTLEAAQVDAVYCSHNLEHYHRHEVPRVLAGFQHVLKPGGFAHVIVPDLQAVMQQAVERKLDVEDTLYQSAAGPITVLDVLYGYGEEIERTGQDFYAHKTGFTPRSLELALWNAGFRKIFIGTERLQVEALAFKTAPDAWAREAFGLPES